MKKFCYTALLLFTTAHLHAAAFNSVVSLPGGGIVPAKSSVNLPLAGLTPLVNYSVVCYIDTTFAFQYIQLGSSFTEATSVVTSYSLNGNYVTQDQLLIGHNVAVIQGNFANPATGVLVFTNLDQTNSFTVSNCFGVPVQGA